MKLDNIMISKRADIASNSLMRGGIFQNADIHIIDFGFACSYLDEEGKHLDQ